MSHHGRAPKERGPSKVRRPYPVHGPTTTSAARRARIKLASYASSRETATAVPRLRVTHKRRLILGGRSWDVAPRPRAEGERPLVSAVPLLSAPTNHNQRSTARAL